MIQIHDINFEVSISKKRIRNIYLRLEGNKIMASCPYYVPNYEVYNFIESKKTWLYKAYLAQASKRERSLLYRGGDSFNIFGKEYRLVRSIGNKKVSIIGDIIYFSYKDDSEDGIKALYKELDKILLNKAREYLNIHRSMLLDYGYYEEPILNARIMTSKWGVCYTRKNKINISSYLIHYPFECLEYIIVHEITHFIVPNHSSRFYEIVANNMPNYKSADKLLK